MAISEKQNEIKDFKRICSRGALLLLPFLALPLLELFVLPIDFFTFRIWEAVLATPYHYPGAFYPNCHVKKMKEFGDRYRAGDPNMVQSKPAEWYTDGYGFRNRPEIEKRNEYDVVVLGDSNIVGSYLDQKDTLSELLGARSGKTVYSYSVGCNHIALFFSDPRMERKSPKLMVVESKLGNWNENIGYLSNFNEKPDGSLAVAERTMEFSDNYYLPTRNHFLEKIQSRLSKQPMFNWMTASLKTSFETPPRVTGGNGTFLGVTSQRVLPADSGWKSENWKFGGWGTFKRLEGEPQPGVAIRAKSPNYYWQTERFFCARQDGKITVRFQAKNSAMPTRHRVYIFEDGIFRSVGEFFARQDWGLFEIPVSTRPGSALELQIVQLDDWQWLSVRDFQVLDGTSRPLPKQMPAPIKRKSHTKQNASSELSINKSPLFESAEGWGPGFSKAIGHGLGVVVGPGADNPNVFAQSFYSKSYQSYTIVARASNPNMSRSKGRFQINWTDSKGQFIAASIESFEVFSEEKKIICQVTAPADTAAGTLYVVADGPSDVVRYTEMSLFSREGDSQKKSTPAVKSDVSPSSQPVRAVAPSEKTMPVSSFPKPFNLTPLDGSGKTLSIAESQYYFYHATIAIHRIARGRNMDFIMFVMPDSNISRLMPAIKQLRSEGIKVLAYDAEVGRQDGVNTEWYWQKADSHWTEAAVRLTADEILTMWEKDRVANRPFTQHLMESYANGFPSKISSDR